MTRREGATLARRAASPVLLIQGGRKSELDAGAAAAKPISRRGSMGGSAGIADQALAVTPTTD
jgi:hypothetical protein